MSLRGIPIKHVSTTPRKCTNLHKTKEMHQLRGRQYDSSPPWTLLGIGTLFLATATFFSATVATLQYSSFKTPEKYKIAHPVSRGQSKWSPVDVCSSAKLLDRFLSQQPSWTKFDKSNPVCEFGAYHHVHVLIPFFNLTESTINRAVSSTIEQNYRDDRLTIWLYDDASEGNMTHNICHDLVYEFDPLNNHSLGNIKHNIDAMEINQRQSRLICIRSTLHLGPGKCVKNFSFYVLNC